MKKIKLFFFLLTALSIGACKDHSADLKVITKEALLTADSLKYWKIAYRSLDSIENHASCKTSSVRNSDNYFLFKKDGVFFFDHGKIVEDPKDGTCKDPGNFTGIWRFESNKDSLIIVSQKKDPEDTSIVTETSFLRAFVSRINSLELRLITKGKTNSDTIVYVPK